MRMNAPALLTPAARETAPAVMPAPGCFTVILAERRSGTTVFRALLEENGAKSLGEIFHKDQIFKKTNYFNFLLSRIQERRALIHPSRQPQVFRDYLDMLRKLVVADRIILDVKYPALTLIGTRAHGTPDFFRVLRERNANFLVIARRNSLRSYVSEAIAQSNRKWHGERTQRRPVQIDLSDAFEHVDQACERSLRLRSWLRGTKHREIFYEDMFDGAEFSDHAIETASAILGTRASGRMPRLQKQNPEPMADLVVNFSDLAARFRGTPHEWMLQG